MQVTFVQSMRGHCFSLIPHAARSIKPACRYLSLELRECMVSTRRPRQDSIAIAQASARQAYIL